VIHQFAPLNVDQSSDDTNCTPSKRRRSVRWSRRMSTLGAPTTIGGGPSTSGGAPTHQVRGDDDQRHIHHGRRHSPARVVARLPRDGQPARTGLRRIHGRVARLNRPDIAALT
jgi:hypothetical protein